MDDLILVLTGRDRLRAAAERWCTAVGMSARVVDSVTDARRYWRSAVAVLVGDDRVTEVRRAAWARRDHVHVVAEDGDAWWREAVGVGAVGVLAADDDPAAVAALTQVVDGGAEGCSLVVVGGSGGVGATTFACAVATVGARRGLTSVVVDADTAGPGADLVLGAESVEGLRWPALDPGSGSVSPSALVGSLPSKNGVASIAWEVADERPHLPPAAGSVWSAAVRGFDLVVVDQPRHCADTGWSTAVVGGSVLAVLVVADDVCGLASARRQAAWLADRAASVVTVLARRRHGLGTAAVETALGLPVVGTLRRDRGMRAALDHGRGPGRSRAVRRPAEAVLDLVGLDGSDRGEGRT